MARARFGKLTGFDMRIMTWMAVQEFMPKAAEKIALRARSKIGVYQTNWPALAPSTIRKKSRQRLGSRVKMQKRKKMFGPMSSLDTPLLDKGKMVRGIKHRASRNKAYISAPFLMNIHEQDTGQDTGLSKGSVGAFQVPPNNLPARPVMQPALEECIPDIIWALEDTIVRRMG